MLSRICTLQIVLFLSCRLPGCSINLPLPVLFDDKCQLSAASAYRSGTRRLRHCMQDFTCNSSLRRIRVLNITKHTFDKVHVSTMMNIFYRILMVWYFLSDNVVTGNGLQLSCVFVLGLALGLITSTMLFNELNDRYFEFVIMQVEIN